MCDEAFAMLAFVRWSMSYFCRCESVGACHRFADVESSSVVNRANNQKVRWNERTRKTVLTVDGWASRRCVDRCPVACVMFVNTGVWVGSESMCLLCGVMIVWHWFRFVW